MKTIVIWARSRAPLFRKTAMEAARWLYFAAIVATWWFCSWKLGAFREFHEFH